MQTTFIAAISPAKDFALLVPVLSLTQTTVVMNTVLRAVPVSSAVPTFSVVVERTTLVTVAGGLVVMVAVVGAVVVGEMGDLSVDVVTIVDVKGGDEDGDGDESDIEVAEVWPDMDDTPALDVAKTTPLLSSLDTPRLGTKMRGGTGGTNATTLDAGAPLLYIVFVTTTVAVAVAITVVVLMLILMAGAQAQPGSSCGRAIPPYSLPPVLT